MSRSELARNLGVGRVTLWRYEQAGLIPAPHRISRTQADYSPASVVAIRSFLEAAR